jgi:hypothetical protein
VLLDVVYNHVGYDAHYLHDASTRDWVRTQPVDCAADAIHCQVGGLPDLKTELPAVQDYLLAAHLGLADEAYATVKHASLGPCGTTDDTRDRTPVRGSCSKPACRSSERSALRACARLGLVEFWITSGRWPDCADEVPYDFRAECRRRRLIRHSTSSVSVPGRGGGSPTVIDDRAQAHRCLNGTMMKSQTPVNGGGSNESVHL